jgi:hypothetical protein
MLVGIPQEEQSICLVEVGRVYLGRLRGGGILELGLKS